MFRLAEKQHVVKRPSKKHMLWDAKKQKWLTKEQYEKAAVDQMHAALAEAAIALEKAKAFLNASKRS